MIPGMGKDAPAWSAPLAEAEKVEKSPAQDKKAEPAEKGYKAPGLSPREAKRKGGRSLARAARPRLTRRPLTSPRPPGVGSSPTSIFADSGHAKRASMSKLALLAVCIVNS